MFDIRGLCKYYVARYSQRTGCVSGRAGGRNVPGLPAGHQGEVRGEELNESLLLHWARSLHQQDHGGHQEGREEEQRGNIPGKNHHQGLSLHPAPGQDS